MVAKETDCDIIKTRQAALGKILILSTYFGLFTGFIGSAVK